MCDLACQSNVWSSGHHQMRQQAGHSWDKPMWICGGEKVLLSHCVQLKPKYSAVLLVKLTHFNEVGFLLISCFNDFLVLWNLRMTQFATGQILWNFQSKTSMVNTCPSLTLSCGYQWRLCNLCDTGMRHKPQPLGNGKKSGQLWRSTRYMCDSRHWCYERKNTEQVTHRTKGWMH